MVAAGPIVTDPSVLLGFRVRDAATPELNRLQGEMQETKRDADRMGQSFSDNGARIATLGAAIVGVAGQFSQLAVQLGIIPEQMQQTTTTIIQSVGAFTALIGVIAELNRIQRIHIILTAISRALLTPIGAVTVLAALGVGALAAAAVSRFSQTAPGQFQVVPGTSTETTLARVHGGEVIGRPLGPTGSTPGGGGNVTVNVSAGAFVGTQADADKFALMLGRRLQGLKRRINFNI